MADGPQKDPGRCDTQDRGVTPVRLEELTNEAHAFNNLLRVHEPGPRGEAHKAAALAANKAFYAFLPGEHDLTGGSFEASKEFYEQATRLPIGERRKLLELTGNENLAMHQIDPLMPLMVTDIASDAFIKTLDFHMGGGYSYTFHYLGMCAEMNTRSDIPQNAGANHGWNNIELPTFNFRR
jgi:hypothetical protein